MNKVQHVRGPEHYEKLKERTRAKLKQLHDQRANSDLIYKGQRIFYRTKIKSFIIK